MVKETQDSEGEKWVCEKIIRPWGIKGLTMMNVQRGNETMWSQGI